MCVCVCVYRMVDNVGELKGDGGSGRKRGEREGEKEREERGKGRERERGVSVWRGVCQLCASYMQPTRSQFRSSSCQQWSIERVERTGLIPAPLCLN